MRREQGINLVNQYTSIAPKNLQLFLNWMGITETAFHVIIDQHRNPEIWKRNDDWKWTLKNKNKFESEHIDSASSLPIAEPWKDFVITPVKKSTDSEEQYILIGKGYHE
jgi:hypothetical protein